MHQTLCFLSKYLLFLGLVGNLAVALTLLFTNDSQRTTTGSVYRFVVGNRTATQILVQIASQALGTLLIFAVTTLFNYVTRLRPLDSSASIENLKLWQSVCFAYLDPSLSTPRMFLSLCFLCLVFIPAALWAGALTPFVVSTEVHTSIAIPVYNPDLGNVFWNRTLSRDVQYATLMSSDGNGMYSYNPTDSLSGSIAHVAAFATTKAGPNRTHAKLDNSRYSYRGRSYGVGASVGLLHLDGHSDQSVRNYTFDETGYTAEVTCTQNTTSEWKIHPSTGNCSRIAEYFVKGSLPNSNPGAAESIRVPGLCNDTSRIMAMGGRMVNNRAIVAIATNPKSGP
jgi:hypothetical protein